MGFWEYTLGIIIGALIGAAASIVSTRILLARTMENQLRLVTAERLNDALDACIPALNALLTVLHAEVNRPGEAIPDADTRQQQVQHVREQAALAVQQLRPWQHRIPIVGHVADDMEALLKFYAGDPTNYMRDHLPGVADRANKIRNRLVAGVEPPGPRLTNRRLQLLREAFRRRLDPVPPPQDPFGRNLGY